MADTSFTITIPEAQAERVLAALALSYGYNAETDGPRAAFVKARVINYLRRLVIGAESQAAADLANQTSLPDIQ